MCRLPVEQPAARSDRQAEAGQPAVQRADGLVDVGQRDREPDRPAVDLGQQHLLGDGHLRQPLGESTGTRRRSA